MDIKYLYDLIYLLNNFDGSQHEENQIRNLICFLSNDKECIKDPLYRNVIFEAAEKIRMFGYIKGPTKIYPEEFSQK